MAVTPNMGLFQTIVNSTPGYPAAQNYALEIDQTWPLIDAHDHTTGKGVRVPSAGININADLSFGGFALTAVGAAAIGAITATTILMNGTLNLNGQSITNGATISATTLSAGTANLTAITATTLAMNGNIDLQSHNIVNVNLLTGTSVTLTSTLTAATGSFSGTVTALTVNPTNLGPCTLTGTLAMGSNNITGTGTVNGATGTFTNLSTTTMTGVLAMGTNNITGTGTVNGGTGTFTNLSATTLQGNITGNAKTITGLSSLGTTNITGLTGPAGAGASDSSMYVTGAGTVTVRQHIRATYNWTPGGPFSNNTSVNATFNQATINTNWTASYSFATNAGPTGLPVGNILYVQAKDGTGTNNVLATIVNVTGIAVTLGAGVLTVDWYGP